MDSISTITTKEEVAMNIETQDQVTPEHLRAFADAWNRHDLEDLMSFMAEDCMFQLSSGTNIDGTKYEGRDEVRAGYEAVLKAFPDGHWEDDAHFVSGNRGVSEWIFSCTDKNGNLTKVRGCDIFTFCGSKISVKNSFRKNIIS